MKCGLIYLKIVPESKDLSWIKYCHIFGAIPEPIKEGIKLIVRDVHGHYRDDIIVPLTVGVQNGCVVKEDKVSKIATAIFNRYTYMMSNFEDNPCIRLVYSTGELENIDKDSVHSLNPEDLVVKVGHFLDASDEPGIFRI